MRVVPIAATQILPDGWNIFKEKGFDPYSDPEATPFEVSTRDGDILAEFAGRNCYESFKKPNPATASNAGYLANILEIEHESILEHTSVSFYVSGVSRNLLLELERHRHISFSVISTRYVPPTKMGTVLHPNTPSSMEDKIMEHDKKTRELAREIHNAMAADFSVKECREVARQVLPGNTETKMVVTGNVRAWRYIVNLRAHPKADAEIQMFAKEILRGLKRVAPNSVQDM